MIRLASGIAAPGQPRRIALSVEPFVRRPHDRRCRLSMDVAIRMSAPAVTCARMMATSPRVSGDGFFSTASGIASLPMS